MPTEEKSSGKLELVERDRKKRFCRVVEEIWLCVIPAKEPEEPGATLRGPIYGHSTGLKKKKMKC